MCGIVGMIVASQAPARLSDVTQTLLTALERMQYRGFDSAGLGVYVGRMPEAPEASLLVKEVGGIEVLRAAAADALRHDGERAVLPEATAPSTTVGAEEGAGSASAVPAAASAVYGWTGIAHTRWATNGRPTRDNAHPHCTYTRHPRAASPEDTTVSLLPPPTTATTTTAAAAVATVPTAGGRRSHRAPVRRASTGFSVVHNGIFANHQFVRNALVSRGYVPNGQTDTEVFAWLLQRLYDEAPAAAKPAFPELVRSALEQLGGTYAVLVTSEAHYPYELVAAKQGSPLLVGPSSQHDGFVFGSDAAALEPLVQRIHYLEDGSLVHVVHDTTAASSLSTANPRAAGENSGGEHRVYRLLDVDHPDANLDTAWAWSDSHLLLPPSPASPNTQHRSRVPHDGSTSHSPLSSADGHAASAPAPTDHLWREIWEQPRVLQRVTSALRDQVEGTPAAPARSASLRHPLHTREWRSARRLHIIACGTSYHSGLAARPCLERHLRVPVTVELASEFVERPMLVQGFDNSVCIFISQSGETADTLEALRQCRQRGLFCVGIVNVLHSSVARLCDAVAWVGAGTEVSVASTKAYTCQLMVLLGLACSTHPSFLPGNGVLPSSSSSSSASLPSVGSASSELLCGGAVDPPVGPSMMSGGVGVGGGGDETGGGSEVARLYAALQLIPEQVRETMMGVYATVCQWADRLAAQQTSSILLIGRAAQVATCAEGALKLKELVYVHAEAIPAGELKHGPLALIDENTELVVVATCETSDARSVRDLALPQVVSRGGRPVVVGFREDQEALQVEGREFIAVPRAGHADAQCVLNVLPLQLLAYEWAKRRGCNVDRPRHLAKSVTVN